MFKPYFPCTFVSVQKILDMKKINFSNTLIPILTAAFILFMWFGPITRSMFENVLISLVIMGASFIEYKGKAFRALGFKKENFRPKNLLIMAPIVGLLLFALYVFVVVPGVTYLTGEPIDYSSFDQLEGNLAACLIALVVVWLTAGFGEEIIFRGFFMQQLVKFLGESQASIVIIILLTSCFFGFMHSQQGITGQIVTAIIGGLLALTFYLKQYDLWFVIVVHGVFDTVAIACIYFGLAQ